MSVHKFYIVLFVLSHILALDASAGTRTSTHYANQKACVDAISRSHQLWDSKRVQLHCEGVLARPVVIKGSEARLGANKTRVCKGINAQGSEYIYKGVEAGSGNVICKSSDSEGAVAHRNLSKRLGRVQSLADWLPFGKKISANSYPSVVYWLEYSRQHIKPTLYRFEGRRKKVLCSIESSRKRADCSNSIDAGNTEEYCLNRSRWTRPRNKNYHICQWRSQDWFVVTPTHLLVRTEKDIVRCLHRSSYYCYRESDKKRWVRDADYHMNAYSWGRLNDAK